MPRVTQKVAEPGRKSRVRGRWEPRLPSLQVKVLSLGNPRPPCSGITSHSTSCLHLGLHLSSRCHSHRSWLSSYPSQCILTFTSSLSVVKRNISCSSSGSICPGVQILALPHVQRSKLLSSFLHDSVSSVKRR